MRSAEQTIALRFVQPADFNNFPTFVNFLQILEFKPQTRTCTTQNQPPISSLELWGRGGIGLGWASRATLRSTRDRSGHRPLECGVVGRVPRGRPRRGRVTPPATRAGRCFSAKISAWCIGVAQCLAGVDIQISGVEYRLRRGSRGER